MRKLYVPLLVLIFYLSQTLPASNERNFQQDHQNFVDVQSMFTKAEGMEEILNFFGKEMDEKIEVEMHKKITKLQNKIKAEKIQTDNAAKYAQQFEKINRLLGQLKQREFGAKIVKHDEREETFFLNKPQEWKPDLQKFNFNQLKEKVKEMVGKNAILLGLDNLILKCTNNQIFFSRTGIIQSNEGYFMVRRNVASGSANRNKKEQHFRLFKIKEDQPYILRSKNKENCYFWINADIEKYFSFSPSITPDVYYTDEFIHLHNYKNNKEYFEKSFFPRDMFTKENDTLKSLDESFETDSVTTKSTQNNSFDIGNILHESIYETEFEKKLNPKWLENKNLNFEILNPRKDSQDYNNFQKKEEISYSRKHSQDETISSTPRRFDEMMYLSPPPGFRSEVVKLPENMSVKFNTRQQEKYSDQEVQKQNFSTGKKIKKLEEEENYMPLSALILSDPEFATLFRAYEDQDEYDNAKRNLILKKHFQSKY